MRKVYREEKKFLISRVDFIHKSHQLEQVMIADPHNGTDGYRIRSLYFDTMYDSDYFEKLEGLEVRRKIRLRCYDPESDFAMLEMKQKEGTNQLKRSLKITREDARRLIDCDYSVLLRYSDPFAAECFGIMNCRCYRPKTVVEYNRKAFIGKENKIRVTFDSNIVSTETSFDIFDKRLNMYPVMDPYNVILEIKYNGFLLEYMRKLINSIDKSELSVSKYALARAHGYKYNFGG